MLYLCLLIGAILGVALFEIEGLVPGAFLGYLIYRDRSWQKSVDQLKDQVHSLRNRIKSLESNQEHVNITESFVVVENPGTEEGEPVTQEQQPLEETEKQEEGVHNKGQEAVVEENILEPVINRQEQKDLEPEPMGALESLRALVLKGNWLYLSGIAVLFIGLWLAIDNQIIPIEWSLVLVASIGCILVFIGSRLVNRRPEFGFVMEGGGLAVLYLTIFASFRLYGVLPEATATGLLMAVTMFGVLLGLAQNTQWVSVVSMLGGFLVPVLINTEQGNHVALFSYYAILNMGILATAWYKPWRYLNLTGFVCTFGVATAWGGLFYKPEFFASIQPFLALFFVIYLCIGVLFTLRHKGSIKHAVDGTLVFGLPVIVFALQASLVESFEYGISISCAILGLCYLGTAHWLRFRNSEKVGLLIESFDGIGIALTSLFIPYLFDTMWTGIGWAIEGAALVWLGMRQQRMLLRVSGYLLAIGASIAFINGHSDVSAWGYFPLSVALAFIGCQVCSYRIRLPLWEQFFEPLTMYAGLLFWLWGGLEVLTDWLPYPKDVHALAVFSGITAFLCSFIGRTISWIALARASLFNVFALGLLVIVGSIDAHPFMHWGREAWLVAFAAAYASLFFLEHRLSPKWLGRAHAVYLWMIAFIGFAEGLWLMEEYLPADSAWPLFGSLLVLCVLALMVSLFTRMEIWPFKHHKKAYLRLGLLPLIIVIALISIGGSFENDGDGVYTPYLPVLNLLDIILLGFAGICMFWYRRVSEEGIELGGLFRRSILVWSLVGLMFIWMNAAIARTVHHWTGVPFDSAMWDSSVFQSALSICWTLLAVVTMGIVARRGIRTTWIAAASLLAIVVLKLFTVDLSALSVAPRIISFIGVGILLLIIGYIAPVPPKKAEDLTLPETPA